MDVCWCQAACQCRSASECLAVQGVALVLNRALVSLKHHQQQQQGLPWLYYWLYPHGSPTSTALARLAPALDVSSSTRHCCAVAAVRTVRRKGSSSTCLLLLLHFSLTHGRPACITWEQVGGLLLRPESSTESSSWQQQQHRWLPGLMWQLAPLLLHVWYLLASSSSSCPTCRATVPVKPGSAQSASKGQPLPPSPLMHDASVHPLLLDRSAGGGGKVMQEEEETEALPPDSRLPPSLSPTSARGPESI